MTTGAAVAPSLIASSSVVHSPSIAEDVFVSPPLISVLTVYGPSVAENVFVTPGLIAPSGSVFAPSIAESMVGVTAPLIASAAAFLAPTVTEDVTVSAPFIASATVLPGPTVSSGALVTAPDIASATSLLAPSVVAAQVVAPGLIASATVLPQPTITEAIFLTVPLITSTTVAAAPVVTSEALVAPALIASVTTVQAPAVTEDLGLLAPLIASVTSLPGPSVSADQFVTPGTIGQATVHEPTVITDGGVGTPLIDSVSTAHDPSLTAGASVAPVSIAAAGSVFAPVVAAESPIEAPLIGSVASAPDPTVTADQVVSPGLISATAIYGPTVTANGGVGAPLIGSISMVRDPVVVCETIVETPLIGPTATLSEPTVSGATEVAPPLLASATDFHTPLVATGITSVQIPPASIGIISPPIAFSYGAPKVVAIAPAQIGLTVPYRAAVAQEEDVINGAPSAGGAGAWLEGFEIAGNLTHWQRRYASSAIPRFVAGRKGYGVALQTPVSGNFIEILPRLGNVSASSAILVGMGIYFDDVNNARLASFVYNQIEHAALEFQRIDANSGNLRIRSGATVLASFGPLPSKTWYFIEVKLRVHNTEGRFEVRVDQVPVMAMENVDTRNAASAAVDGLRLLLTTATGGEWRLDDMYVRKGGYDQLDFLGDVSIEALRPDGAGGLSEWTPANAGENFEEVDEVAVDDDATYIHTASSPSTDRYSYGDLDRTRITGRIRSLMVSTTRRVAAPTTGVNLRTVLFDNEESAEKTVNDSQAVELAAWDEQFGVYDTNAKDRAWETQEVDRLEMGVRI